MKPSIISAIMLATTALTAFGAAAQEQAESSGLGDIIVTATKRAESAQSVGIAITAYSSEQLRALGIQDSTDVVTMAPGVQIITPNSGSTSFYTIRGVSQNDFADHQESPVAVYIDDVYQSQASAAIFTLIDLERVEILRGPQGTLFGRNATGGLVHYISKRPTKEFEGFVNALYGRHNQVRLEGAVGGPLSETLGFRVALAHNRHDSIVENRIGPDFQNGKDWGGRVQFLYDAGEDLEILLSARGARQDVRAGSYQHRAGFPDPVTGVGVPLPANVDFWGTGAGNDLFGYRDTDGDDYAVDHDARGFNDLKFGGVTGRIEYTTDSISITSVTDYSGLRKRYFEDSDAGPQLGFHFGIEADVTQFSQELRLGGEAGAFKWLLGGYYLNIDGDYAISAQLGPVLGGPVRIFDPYSVKTKTYAGFVQGDYAFTDKFTATAGFRWTHDKKNFVFDTQARDLDTNELLADIQPTVRRKISKGDWSARVQLDYQMTGETLIFLSWNRGIKSGGFNAPLDVSGLSGIDDPRYEFESETLNAFELGVKTDLFDGMARFNSSVFYYDYKNYQGFDVVGLTQFIKNIPAEIYGWEMEFQAKPTDGLTIMLGSSLQSAKGTGKKFTLPGGQAINPDLALAPDFTGMGLISYEFPLGSGSLTFQADGNYKSKHVFSLSNGPAIRQKGYGIANARVTYASEDDRWSLAAFCENCTGTNYNIYGIDIANATGIGVIEDIPGKPRWWGLEFRYNFGGN
jgi:iron complex outermembrane recepter protein